MLIHKKRFAVQKAVLAVLLILVMLAMGCHGDTPTQADQTTATQPPEAAEVAAIKQPHEAKNIILLIGDGMGFAQITLARLMNDGQPLFMDTFENTGSVSTYHHNGAFIVTDSAAAGTAIACGVQPKNYSVGVDKDGNAVKSILMYAKEAGKATGLVTTTRVTDATVAAFAAHSARRGDEQGIALQMLAAEPDVLLGGGADRFTEKQRDDGADLKSAAVQQGYTLVENTQELLGASHVKLLGLFARNKMPYAIDKDEHTPSLKQMTEKSLEILSQDPDGFFLMVEGGRIDHAGHANDAAAAALEVLAFDEAVGAALEFARNHEDTLVIVTADHETGGLCLGMHADQQVNKAGLLEKQTGSIFDYIVPGIDFESDSFDYAAFAAQHFHISDLKNDELLALTEAFAAQRTNKSSLAFGNALADLAASRSNISWATRDHSGHDVPVMAYGPSAALFTGYMENTRIFDLMKEAMGF